jgi:heptosyltransferase-1
MYKDSRLSSRILIIKTSSLGDIIQSLGVVSAIRKWRPDAEIHWVADPAFTPLLEAYPLIDRVWPLPTKGMLGRLRALREGLTLLRRERFDLALDLQGNVKSGLITYAVRAAHKVGLGFRTAREWPAALFVDERIEVPRTLPIRQFYREMVRRALKGTGEAHGEGEIAFQTGSEERLRVLQLAASVGRRPLFLICPHSKWPNKQLPLDTWSQFLARVDAFFLFAWGSETERGEAEQLASRFPDRSALSDRFPVPVWHFLMSQVDGVIAVDSSALHLAAVAHVPTFSLFGPSRLSVFQPVGELHGGIEGTCPYGVAFEKTCPRLRTCPTGACLTRIAPEAIFERFVSWRQRAVDRRH